LYQIKNIFDMRLQLT